MYPFFEKTVCETQNFPSYYKLHLQVHLNKLECRGKVHLFQ